MANINGATITSGAGQPVIHYYTQALTSRTSNSSVNVTFKIKGRLNSSGSFFGTGYQLRALFTVSGVQKTVLLKTNAQSWSGNGWQTEYTLDFGAVGSTSAGDINITFAVDTSGSNLSGNAGTISATTYQLTMPPLLTTACTAPTSFSASPAIYEDVITLTWSGASGGINNSISRYYIQYRTSADGSNWSAWTSESAWHNPGSGASSLTLASSGYAVIALARGYYVQFQIRTEGAAGSGYYSGFGQSGSIRKNRAPSAPAFFSVTPDPFETTVNLALGTVTDADGNYRGQITIQYIRGFKSGDMLLWVNPWSLLYTGTTPPTTHTPPISDGEFIQYRAYAIDDLGISSELIYSPVVQRDDGAGITLTVGGTAYKAKVFVSRDGAVYKGKPFLSRDNTVYKGKS